MMTRPCNRYDQTREFTIFNRCHAEKAVWIRTLTLTFKVKFKVQISLHMVCPPELIYNQQDEYKDHLWLTQIVSEKSLFSPRLQHVLKGWSTNLHLRGHSLPFCMCVRGAGGGTHLTFVFGVVYWSGQPRVLQCLTSALLKKINVAFPPPWNIMLARQLVGPGVKIA